MSQTQTVSEVYKKMDGMFIIGKLLGTSFSRNIILETAATTTNLGEKLKLVIVIGNQLYGVNLQLDVIVTLLLYICCKCN